MTTDKFIWWEKTVEYSFVLRAAKLKGHRFFNPLAGIQERAGDAIFGDDDKLVLIEFKRSVDDLNSEERKFLVGKYEEAKKCLADWDSHHFLIYGEAVDLDRIGIVPRAQRYFSRKPIGDCFSIFEHGVGSDFFKKYLQIFLNCKKPDDRSSGSGAVAMTNVIGISQDGSKCAILPLSEYCVRCFPEYKCQPSNIEAEVDEEAEPNVDTPKG